MECYGTMDVCSNEQADRIEKKLDELLEFRDLILATVDQVKQAASEQGPFGVISLMQKLG